MPGRYWILLLFIGVACVEDEFPTGLYHYQIERLLATDTNKTWLLAESVVNGASVRPSVCQDSVRLLFINDSDSVNVSILSYNATCSAFDTTRLGNANASGDLVFTDSLNFADGREWIVESILPNRLTINTDRTTSETYFFE